LQFWICKTIPIQRNSKMHQLRPWHHVYFSLIQNPGGRGAPTVSRYTTFLFFFTGAWTQGLHLEPLHRPYFCDGFFRVSPTVFAWAGFELWSSWSLPPAYIELQAGAAGARLSVAIFLGSKCAPVSEGNCMYQPQCVFDLV
jgi:hypothetical protein